MSQQKSRVNFLFWIAIASFSFAIFLAGFYKSPVPTVDGAIRAVEARTIVETGTWFPIQYQGAPVADHPPLYVWLLAASFKAFGVSDAAANFPMHFFSFLLVLVIAVLARRSGMSATQSLLAVFVLCTTRDFVLSSVRGYIEPVLSLFVYFAFYLVLSREQWSSLLAGVCIFLAFFAKGPPLLWPLLFFAGLLIWKKEYRKLGAYIGGFVACIVVFCLWNSIGGHWPIWKKYWQEQVLASAVEGRGGAQQLQPFYFLDILVKFYWPWVLVLGFCLVKEVLESGWMPAFAGMTKKHLSPQRRLGSIPFLILAVGFIAGFSLVKWKFWYYIAPAYPALALFIASGTPAKLEAWFEKRLIPITKGITALSAVWIFAVTVFHIPLHKERVPEIHAFKKDILNSPTSIPVYFSEHEGADHNQYGTSGEWYFHRIVEKLSDEKSLVHLEKAWIIAGKNTCEKTSLSWCMDSQSVQMLGRSTLYLWISRGMHKD